MQYENLHVQNQEAFIHIFGFLNLAVLYEYSKYTCNDLTLKIVLLFAEGLFSGYCSCHTVVCAVIGRAEKFLTPLLVEYCLVSSCLFYVMWSHIGKDSKHHGPVARPSHKFYKSYKGNSTFIAIFLLLQIV